MKKSVAHQKILKYLEGHSQGYAAQVTGLCQATFSQISRGIVRDPKAHTIRGMRKIGVEKADW